MKFHVTMKCPDALVTELADDGEAPQDGYLSEAPASVRKWFEYDEYALVEIDTEAGTAVLVKPSRY